MTENPYAAPRAELGEPIPDFEADPAVLKRIREACYAGLFSGGVTLLATLVAMSGVDLGFISAWTLVDVVLIFGLTYGIHRKSRTCAVLLSSYFILTKLYEFGSSGKLNGAFVAVAICVILVRGAIATFTYHKARREHEPANCGASRPPGNTLRTCDRDNPESLLAPRLANRGQTGWRTGSHRQQGTRRISGPVSLYRGRDGTRMASAFAGLRAAVPLVAARVVRRALTGGL